MNIIVQVVMLLLLLLLLLLQVIRDWEGYNKMLKGAQLFITQMQKMVGLEPKDSSYGNTTLIPTYVVSCRSKDIKWVWPSVSIYSVSCDYKAG